MKTIIIVGAGPVGALEACYMARRGYFVKVFEMRQDIRTSEILQRGTSSSLTISYRGLEALGSIGIKDDIKHISAATYGDIFHYKSGKSRVLEYGRKDHVTYSVDRSAINKLLISAAEESMNVSLHFEHKLIDCNIEKRFATFQRRDGSILEVQGDLIIGCDGAFSTIRRIMMKKFPVNYEQSYVPHVYVELYIPPQDPNQTTINIEFNHVWPRNRTVMFAHLNADKSFSVSLILPPEMLNSLNTRDAILRLFEDEFRDTIPFIGEERIVETFMNSKYQSLMTIKCYPYHFEDKVLLLGDAAHTMLPFYGQGTNCGFEDCLILDELMDIYADDIGCVLTEFTSARSVDACAMSDLTIQRYAEFIDPNSAYLCWLRDVLDNCLYTLFKDKWTPLYTNIVFSRTRYHKCVKHRKWQERMICWFICTVAALGFMKCCFSSL